MDRIMNSQVRTSKSRRNLRLLARTKASLIILKQ